MKRPPWVWASLAIAIGVAVLLIVNLVAVAMAPSDETQIRAAIETLRVASIEGKSGGVQQYLSDAFQLPEGISAEGGFLSSPKAEVAKFIRQAKVNKLDVTVRKISINGAEAYAMCDISFDLAYLTQQFSQTIGAVRIEFRKEPRRRLLLIPDSKWMVLRFGNIDPGQISW
jgi:hypothetical protein